MNVKQDLQGKSYNAYICWNVSTYRPTLRPKGKASPLHAREANRGSKDMGVLTPNLGTIKGCLISLTPRPLCRREKGPWNPLNRKVGGLQCWSGHDEEEKGSLPLKRIEHTVVLARINHYTTWPMPVCSLHFSEVKSQIFEWLPFEAPKHEKLLKYAYSYS
jgi:hypothetical protein